MATPALADSLRRGTDSTEPPTVSPGAPPRSAAEARRGEEIERSRVFFNAVVALAIGGIVVALCAHGDPTTKATLIGSSLCSGLSALYARLFELRPERYHPRNLMLPGVPVLFGALCGVYFWGSVSPVTGMLVYGIYFFSLGQDRRFIAGIVAVLAVGHAALCVGIMTGVLVDRGVVPVGNLPIIDQVALLAIIETLYVIAFVTARLSERANLRAVTTLEHAIRAVAHREALLAEARSELERVRDLGGAGRYTDVTLGSYRLGHLIGRGAIGEVYDASHVATGGTAAIKLLRADAVGDEMQVRRLLREAEAVARIASPHVVRVLDVGTVGVPFIAMERLRGHDLAHELRTRRRLDLGDARDAAVQIARGLDAAHAAGIVHRDLKPHNVFGALEPPGRVWKILDFGVSKLGATGTLTGAQVVGTPSYMAPEQARREDVDRRADVYALAAILYRAVTGYAAFDAADIATTLYDVVYRVPARPSALAELPADLDRVLALGLAKERADRFDTAGELAAWFVAATGDGLTAAQRSRADAVIARSPWSTACAPSA